MCSKDERCASCPPDNQEMVRNFHAGHDGGQPDFNLARRLIFEEMDELYSELHTREELGYIPEAEQLPNTTFGKVDRKAVIKEMADVMYVLYGFADRFNIDLDEAFRRVHASNMTKMVNGHTVIRPDGKLLKPDTYVSPELGDL